MNSILSVPNPPAARVASLTASRWPDPGTALALALDAVLDCARLAWWDGSAVGLRLNQFGGLLDLEPFDGVRPRREAGR